jgi:Arc/MetJ family transcription regulator
MSKSIRVDEDTHAALASLKGDSETFDDLLTRLIRERREAILSGAGRWAAAKRVISGLSRMDWPRRRVATASPSARSSGLAGLNRRHATAYQPPARGSSGGELPKSWTRRGRSAPSSTQPSTAR